MGHAEENLKVINKFIMGCLQVANKRASVREAGDGGRGGDSIQATLSVSGDPRQHGYKTKQLELYTT
jgi:hypothetical protein